MRQTLNFINSIKKYFNLETKYPTDSYIDELLEKYKFKNVVLVLLDGFGMYNMNLNLNKNSFLQKHLLFPIQTCFPPTTVAATGMIETGCTPGDNNRLGWFMYSETDKKKFVTFNAFKDSEIHLTNDELNELKLDVFYHNFSKENIGLSVGPYGDICCKSFIEQAKKIKDLVEKNNKNEDNQKMYIYAYCPEPDSTEHVNKMNSKKTRKVIKNLNSIISKELSKLEDTIVFVIADHGHIDAEYIYLPDYPEIFNLLDGDFVIEGRALSVKIKEGHKEEFKEKFNKIFGQYFTLLTKQEVLDKEIFGKIKLGSIADKSIFDYLIISETFKTLALSKEDMELVGLHAGHTREELEVPLIAIYNTKN